jgi:CheY-like chemotaxis protein
LNVSVFSKIEHENVIGDEQRLQQVCMNILGNAIKFTPEGGKIVVTVEETTSHVPDRGCYRITIEDDGIGMEQEFLDRIFDPFVRSEDSRVHHVEGSGLGMAIANNIVRMMGGNIQVTSELGKGSRFVVTVFLRISDAAAEEYSFPELTALVVDDEEIACESACDVLKSLDISSEYVLNGNDAVARMAEASRNNEEFSLVLLDWKMPGKDGIETAREIRSVVGEDVPIIILTAYDWTEIEQEALEVGISGFVEKPLFKSKLTYVLRDLVKGETPEREISHSQQEHRTDKSILLVDDIPLNLEIAAEFIHSLGYKTDMVYSGEAALEHLQAHPEGYYSMIFMDIHMEGIDGYEATRRIRSLEREDLREIPIIAMTADAFTDDIRKAQEAGMNGHVSKPVSIEMLGAEIARWIK